jgi:hypothetical protein
MGTERTDVAFNPGDGVDVSGSNVQVVAANKQRAEITLANDHATQVIYLSLGGTAALNTGIRLNPAGGSWSSTSYTGAISAIASGATTRLLRSEV